MPEIICPLGKLSLGTAIRFCDEEKCAWFDVDDDCCCIRVMVRALEDLASMSSGDTLKQIEVLVKKRVDELEAGYGK